jgi:GT2 family glycosyltransferase
MSHSPLLTAAARLRRRSHQPTTAGERLPLSALRARLDEKSAGAKWLLHADGVLGRALMLPAGATFTVPLKLVGEVSFSGRAMLLPHDWRDRHGAVRASVAIIDEAGQERQLWAGTLWASDRGRPRGRHVECRLPASTTGLRLRVRGLGTAQPMSMVRAIWLEPAIVDPHAPPIARRPSGRDPQAPPIARSASGAVPAPASRSNSRAPLISVLTPVHDPPPDMLEAAIASVVQQTFTDWELCLVDDGCTSPEIIAALERHAAADRRIRLKRRDTAGGISAATNTALGLATGRYIALMDHDDALTPGALQRVAEQLAAEPELDMVYSDEDVVSDTGMVERHPKPGWSPEHMSALMYTCHLGVYRRTLALELGGFQSRFDGCQDYDFVLRLMERTDRIAHIPEILYHWRAHGMSTAGGDAKPYAYLAQPAAIADHLQRSGIDAEVQFAHLPGIHRIVHRVPSRTSVAFVLAVANHQGLAQAAASWLAQPHPAWEVVLSAGPQALEDAIAELVEGGVPRSRIMTVSTGPHDNCATALAAAADATAAEHLLFMQTPAAGLTNDWLTRLIGYSGQASVGAAGPVVLSQDGRIQQAGVAIPDGIPLYLRYGSDAAIAQAAVYNVSAVSGVLATRRDIYHQVGGLHPEFRDLALIDYCLRATDAGQRVVIVPDARLRAAGPDTNTNDLDAIWRLRQSWAQTHTHDPYYNPNYRTDRGDYVLGR